MAKSSADGGDRTLQHDQAGVTLVELMVALSILAIIFTGVAAGLIQATALASEARLRAVATSIAAEELDLIRSRDFDLLAAETVARDVDAANGTFTVERSSRWITDDSSTDACTAASFATPDGIRPAFLRVDVEVGWPTQRNDSRPVSTSTIVSPPVEALDPTKGHLAVTVRNAAGEPQGGVQVSGAGPAMQTKMTDENGCAFFAYVDSGEWQLTLDQTGWVDRQGNLSTSVTEFVNAGEVATIEFSYDRAAALETTLVSAHAAPIPAGLVRTATGPELTVTQEDTRFINLFPFPSGYDAWSGCEDNAPYLYGADVVGAAPLPGTTVSLDLPMPTVTVRAAEGTRLLAQSGSTQVQCSDPIDLGTVERLDEGLYGEDVFGLNLSLPFGPWRFEDADGGDDPWCQTVVLGGDADGAPEHRDDLILEADCAPLETPPDGVDPEPDRYFIVTTTAGEGSILLDPPGGIYDAGTTVEVTAVPDTGWLFDGWSQDLTGTTNPVVVTVGANTDITATFSEEPPPPPEPIMVTAEWTFPSLGNFLPDSGAEHGVGAIRNPKGLDPFGVMNNDDGTLDPDVYEYPDQPQLRVGALSGATNLEEAVDQDSFIALDVVPQDGAEITFQSLSYDVARGGDSTPRGLVVRSSEDAFTSNLGGGDVTTVRNMSRVSIDLTGLPATTAATTFRLYIYAPNGSQTTLELDNIELRFETVPS